MSIPDPLSPESGIEALLASPEASTAELRAALENLYLQYSAQRRLLDRLTRISDHFQRAEREHGITRFGDYERKVRQIEKIVRISDRYQAMLRELNDRLTQLSTHDELTGLTNRRFASEQIEREISYQQRHGGSLVFALADLDHFKRINDGFGHQTGDLALIEVARTLQENLRPYDTCARWGGEEFLLLLPQTSAAAATALCERLRTAIAALPEIAADEVIAPPTKLSVSIGLTCYIAGEPPHATLARIDDALYEAKKSGRDKVVCLA